MFYEFKDDNKTPTSLRTLVDVYGLFKQAQLDTSRTCVYWNDKIDLASDSIYEYGKAASYIPARNLPGTVPGFFSDYR